MKWFKIIETYLQQKQIQLKYFINLLLWVSSHPFHFAIWSSYFWNLFSSSGPERRRRPEAIQTLLRLNLAKLPMNNAESEEFVDWNDA